MNPDLIFEFMDHTGNMQRTAFCDPIKIYQTNSLTEVTSIFNKVENAIDAGYYVAGYVSYEAAPAFEARFNVKSNSNLPLVWFGVYEAPSATEATPLLQDYTVSDWTFTSSEENYQDGIRDIKQAIARGDTYQVNYTSRLQATFTGDDFAFYKQLVENQQAPYSAYLNIGDYQILSASPELFFRVNNNTITTKPMKGTSKRGRYGKEDQQLIEQLTSSEKERAENLMIVDLLRNDIGKIAKKGTVHVPNLLDVESYPTVNQMTSTVTAELEEDTHLLDWFTALFPCGSITGAPKIKTMSYIAELEDTPREVYCGAIGFVTPEKEATFNVPIRTVIIDKKSQMATYGVGGGITWDSTVENEYQEMKTKAKMLTEQRPDFQLLESILLDNASYPLLSYHMARLLESARYFNFEINIEKIKQTLNQVKANHPSKKYKVRLLVSKTGEIFTEVQEVKEIIGNVTCTLAKSPIDEEDPFLFHKTTNRTQYKNHQVDEPTVFSTLLWNKQHELTEFIIGNVVVEKAGMYYTPPVDCGLLAGTYRAHLLDTGIIQEQVIKYADLGSADRIWFINSVRGWLPVTLNLK
ncbi:aminodeoxychorismate synthase component I [Paraliobacillus sediminis]|uniref:aminodeoxychorismate synthase component I n=1 Tax=Paraliobacillus sediminis TaxID=1885916 RepID=UPI000E3C9BB2|nr:aminodeoxychorismate synthase component I [Paraliobacillus sediminis]